jgi:hypothetical protein
VATLGERILAAIRYAPLDDDVLAKRLGVGQRQSINQAARRLESLGRLRRYIGPGGKIVNALIDESAPPAPADSPSPRPAAPGSLLTEDEVKAAVRAHLAVRGFEVAIAWGRVRGIDIDARHPDGLRYVIEAKAEVALQPQQVNYFIGALGELVQRMDDPDATYGLALPDNRQYRGLVSRLPALARRRLGLVVFWVRRDADGFHVNVDSDIQSDADEIHPRSGQH